MPKAVPVTLADALELFDRLEALGYRWKGKREVAKDIEAYGLEPPSRKSRPGEISYILSSCGLDALFHSTVDRSKFALQRSLGHRADYQAEVGIPTSEDVCHSLISDSRGEHLYFARESRRTLRFVSTAARRARTTRDYVMGRPLCPECKRFMNLERNRFKPSRKRWWSCNRVRRHKDGENVTLGLYAVLSAHQAKEQTNASRQAAAQRLKTKKLTGRDPVPSFTRRKAWKKTRDPHAA